MPCNNVAYKVEELRERLIKEGNLNEALKVGIKKWSELITLVDEKFPITRQSSEALSHGDDTYFQIRDAYRRGLYEIMIRPSEAFLNKN